MAHTTAPSRVNTAGGRHALRAGVSGRLLLAVCFGLPALAFGLSYVWLAVANGRWNLWPVIVHESGRYTLAGTVFYFSHFLREVPTVLAYAFFLLGVAGASGGAGIARSGARARAPLVWAGAALLVVVLAFLGAVRTEGFRSALLDLLQYRTRDDVAGYGSHWRYHLLSTLWFGSLTASLPWLSGRLLPESVRVERHRGWSRIAWLYFAALTLVFGVSAEIVTDTRYAGHQAREIFTHATTTLPLGLGLLLALGRSGAGRADAVAARTGLLLVPVFVIPVFLALVALSGDVMAAGQSSLGLAPMIAGHYFEHALDQVLLVLLLMAGVVVARSEHS